MHAVHKMRPAATNAACSVVCVSVCWSVTRMCCAKTSEPIEMPFGPPTYLGPVNHVLDGVQNRDPPWEWANLGLVGPLKIIGSLCSGVCSKIDHSILNNGMTPPVLQPTEMLSTVRCHTTLSP